MREACVERLLIVEDAVDLREGLVAGLRGLAKEVVGVGTIAEARQFLAELRPDLVLLDVVLPDGTGLDLLNEMATLAVAPCVVVMTAEATNEQTFRLAQLGAVRFLQKPAGLAAVEEALFTAATMTPDLRPQLRVLVGRRPVHAVEHEIRRWMVEEALARAGGSRRAAARLLSVSRQLLQHMLRSLQQDVR